MKPKLIFFGTPVIGKIVLEALIQSSYKPVAVVTKEDKPAGRGQKPTPTPVKRVAEKYDIPILQPLKLSNNPEFIRKIKGLAPDLGIVAAYGKIIPPEILNVPKYGILNIHPSLLPKFRGPSPIQSAILAGEKITGVTIILMNEYLDEGDILIQKRIEILPSDTTAALAEKLAKAGAKLLIEVIPKWFGGKIKPRPQNHLEATYTSMFTKADGKIDSENPPDAARFGKMVRAFHPWPGVYTEIQVKRGREKKRLRIKFLPNLAYSLNRSSSQSLILVQPEGKELMTIKEFLNGYPEAQEFISKIL